MTDKRYRECMAEIDAALKKYDMAAAVTLVSPDRAMFKYTWPTWSCIRTEGGSIRFKAMSKDYPGKGDQEKAVELSVHVILQMRDIAAQTFAMCDHIEKTLREKFEIEHKSFQDFDPEISH